MHKFRFMCDQPGVLSKSKWKPLGSAFIEGAEKDLLDGALDKPAGLPDARAALFSLLGMGPLVHEGNWFQDVPGLAKTMESSFYADVRKAIGLARWEYGHL